MSPLVVEQTQLEVRAFLEAGDQIVVGEACAEPTVLVDALVDQASSLMEMTVFAGLTYRERFAESALRIVSYGALGKLARARDLTVLPCHFSALPVVTRCDVAMIQVSPPDRAGRCSYGAGAEYFADLAERARVVIAEVNDHCPRSRGASIAWDSVDVAVMTSKPLVEATVCTPRELDQRIANHVAGIVRDGDTIQVGVGVIPEAATDALAGHSDLRVHSGIITDGVLRLMEGGATSQAHLCVAGAAPGSRQLFDALEHRDEIRIMPTSHTHAPATLASVGRLCAINSALEVDLDGQAGSESIDGRLFGGIGGQVDFLRGATSSGGAAILALPSARIVERLRGPVSVARADVDWVVTEYGARSLRGKTALERRVALSQIAEIRTGGSFADGL